MGCILTLGECVCVCLCLSHSVSFSLTQAHKHTSPCMCVYAYYMRAHKYLSTHSRMCVYTEVCTHLCHTHPHTHTSNLQLSEALCAYVYVCPYAHCSVCVCAYTGISRYTDKHSLSSQQRLYAAVILPYKNGIPSFLPSFGVLFGDLHAPFSESLPSCRIGIFP